MNPRQQDFLLELRSLRSVAFRHEEHLELLLEQALEGRLTEIPLWTCCEIKDPKIGLRELADISVVMARADRAFGTLIVDFAARCDQSLEPNLLRARIEFELFIIDGLMRFRCYNAN